MSTFETKYKTEIDHIKRLIADAATAPHDRKSGWQEGANNAMKYSQAACNAANALHILAILEGFPKD